MNIAKLEKHYGQMLFTESEAKGVFYVTCANDNRIGIVVGDHAIALTEQQAHAVARELRPMCALYIGRGRLTERRGRPHR